MNKYYVPGKLYTKNGLGLSVVSVYRKEFSYRATRTRRIVIVILGASQDMCHFSSDLTLFGILFETAPEDLMRPSKKFYAIYIRNFHCCPFLIRLYLGLIQ